ncbi:hypothetical protein [Nocardioides sp.]|uniref:hypothetical protein n=1 Tax=Nocardioides sp. TaxID=35761 RepID=UPI002C5FAED6|nr:hypothetical protein [Nocardioides sp.]HSX67606.1 hypothetical protein [Nocardioides sp.]
MKKVILAIAVLALVALALASCPTSQGSLKKDAQGMPGVVSAEAFEAEGDDAIPFQNIPKEVRVVISRHATAAEILNVVAKYDDEGDNLNGVEVVFQGDRHRVAFYGDHASTAMIEDFASAYHDPAVTSYQMTGSRTGFWVDERRESTSLPELVATAERKFKIAGADAVYVSAGRRLGVSLDPGNGDVSVARARIAFALDLLKRVPLTGAVIDGRDSLVLFVAPTDLVRTERWVRSHASTQVGDVKVNPKGPSPW